MCERCTGGRVVPAALTSSGHLPAADRILNLESIILSHQQQRDNAGNAGNVGMGMGMGMGMGNLRNLGMGWELGNGKWEMKRKWSDLDGNANGKGTPCPCQVKSKDRADNSGIEGMRSKVLRVQRGWEKHSPRPSSKNDPKWPFRTDSRSTAPMFVTTVSAIRRQVIC